MAIEAGLSRPEIHHGDQPFLSPSGLQSYLRLEGGGTGGSSHMLFEVRLEPKRDRTQHESDLGPFQGVDGI